MESDESNVSMMETTQLVLSNEQELDENGGVCSTIQSTTVVKCPSRSALTTATQDGTTENSNDDCGSNNDYCGSPSSDITDRELAQVITQGNLSNRDLKASKNGHDYSESPSSDFECNSSCAEDSGISSTVRDDEMEEIPLADGNISPELFNEMSKLNVNDMVSSWVPKSNNTYSPSASKMNADKQTVQNKRK